MAKNKEKAGAKRGIKKLGTEAKSGKTKKGGRGVLQQEPMDMACTTFPVIFFQDLW